MNNRFVCALALLLLVFTACQRPLVSDDQPDAGPWTETDITTERVIQNLHGTPFELYAATENEFVRINKNTEVVERRPLDVTFGTTGVPTLSDNVMSRVKFGSDNQQVLEFHLTRSPSEVARFTPDQFLLPDDNTLLYNLPLGHPFGAFDDDNRLFLIPVRVFGSPRDHMAFLLFDLRQNALFTEFESVELIAREDILDLGAQENLVNSVRYVDGNFYVATLNGAWRIAPDGTTEKIFSQWMLDFFELRGNLYATGLNSFDLHVSYDSGATWERINENSDLKYPQVHNERVFNQAIWGASFGLSEDLKTTKRIIYPEAIPSQDFDKFYGVSYFDDRYFFSADKSIWWSTEPTLE